MPRHVFYSFHYDPDKWRASQVREIGSIEGDRLAHDNDWETVRRSGDAAIARWIDDQMNGTSCTVVLIGEETANRKWINYEIIKTWKEGKGLLGVYIHNLLDNNRSPSRKGANPFDYIKFEDGTKMSSIVRAYDPQRSISTEAYGYIRQNLASWIDEAISIRSR